MCGHGPRRRCSLTPRPGGVQSRHAWRLTDVGGAALASTQLRAAAAVQQPLAVHYVPNRLPQGTPALKASSSSRACRCTRSATVAGARALYRRAPRPCHAAMQDAGHVVEFNVWLVERYSRCYTPRAKPAWRFLDVDAFRSRLHHHPTCDARRLPGRTALSGDSA